jgi:hypothetical protein
MNCIDLLAIRVERRRVAIAAFSGTRLDYVQVRELPSDRFLAARSARRFVGWVTEVFAPGVVVLEEQPMNTGPARADLYGVVVRQLRSSFSTRVHVYPAEIREYLGVPGPRSRTELREIGHRIWPELSNRLVNSAAYDAAALGLHLQMTSLFSLKK